MADPRRDEDMLIVRTREAHEALRDLKVVVREVRDLITAAELIREKLLGAIAVAAQAEVDERIETAISTGLANYAGAIESAIHEAEDSIFERFDTLMETLLDSPAHGQARTAWQMEQMHKALDKKIGRKPVQSD